MERKNFSNAKLIKLRASCLFSIFFLALLKGLRAYWLVWLPMIPFTQLASDSLKAHHLAIATFAHA